MRSAESGVSIRIESSSASSFISSVVRVIPRFKKNVSRNAFIQKNYFAIIISKFEKRQEWEYFLYERDVSIPKSSIKNCQYFSTYEWLWREPIRNEYGGDTKRLKSCILRYASWEGCMIYAYGRNLEKYGGEREIRTPGILRYAPFPRVCTRPLCDLSKYNLQSKNIFDWDISTWNLYIRRWFWLLHETLFLSSFSKNIHENCIENS